MAEVQETRLAGGSSRPGSARTDEGPDTRDGRIGAILNDFLDRRKRGEHVSEAELLMRYPDLADELRKHLATLREMESPADKIARLIDQGLLAPSRDAAYLAELGPYRIEGYLGRGGMGIVLKAHEPTLKRTVAVKLLRPELATDATALRRFEREAQAAAKLQHPSIVTVHAVVLDGRSPYIMMEYVAGRSLADLIREHGPLDAEAAREIFRQLLAALGAAHEAGLIHRDIKAANILLQDAEPGEHSADTPSSPSLKLADFGLARVLTSQTRLTLGESTLGTPEYMSPEQARGEEEIDQRSDLYSAGVVLYEMLTGRTPFRAERPSAVIHRILHEEPEDPRQAKKDVDPVLRSVALRLMAKEPGDRIEAASAVAAAIDSGRPVRSHRQRPWRRYRWGLALVGVVAAAVAWVVYGMFARMPVIGAVRVDPDIGNRVQVRYGDSAVWQQFHEFGGLGKESLNDAAVVDVDGNGDHLVAISSHLPLDEDGNVLICMGANREVRWRLDLRPSETRPGLKAPSGWWRVRRMLVEDLDGRPGDEIVVVASDPHENPSQVSVIDPTVGVVRATFWHIGQIREIEPVYDYPLNGRIAILAWGRNDAMDDDSDSLLAGVPRTSHDCVTAVMLLDPTDMDGIAPPYAVYEGIGGASPIAYGYLDLPANKALRIDELGVTMSRPATIKKVFVEHAMLAGGQRALLFRITTNLGAQLITGEALLIRDIVFADTTEVTDRDFWRGRWKRIIPITSSPGP